MGVNDALSDIHSSQSMVVDDKDKIRAKKRTFSINSSILMPSHGRKTSKVPAGVSQQQSKPSHAKNSMSLAHGHENYKSVRPNTGSDFQVSLATNSTTQHGTGTHSNYQTHAPQ